jgi:hypothetical protein
MHKKETIQAVLRGIARLLLNRSFDVVEQPLPASLAELMQRFEKTGLTEQEDIHASQKRLFTKNHKFKHQDWDESGQATKTGRGYRSKEGWEE